MSHANHGPADRHTRLGRAAVVTVAAVLVATACSAGPDPQPEPDTAPSASTSAPSPATSTPSEGAASTTAEPTPELEVLVDGVPEELAEVVQGLYAGEQVAASASVAEALTGGPDLTGTVEVHGSTGSWGGQDIAVLTFETDLTLAVTDDDEWRIVGGVWPSLGVNDPVLGGVRHILLIGSDAREQYDEPVDGMRADSLQVLGVDGTGGGAVMGIARDAWVQMPDGRQAKINEAMVQAGPQGQVETVARVTGLPIEGYVLVGFRGFRGFVNDWGGLQLEAPTAFDGFPAGEQTLDGRDLLDWLRHRYTLPRGDFDRSFHHGVALAAMGLQARADGPHGLLPLLASMDRRMESDLDAEQILTFAAWTYHIDPGRLGHRVAVGDFGWSQDGQSIVHLDDAARRTFTDFADGTLDR